MQWLISAEVSEKLNKKVFQVAARRFSPYLYAIALIFLSHLSFRETIPSSEMPVETDSDTKIPSECDG